MDIGALPVTKEFCVFIRVAFIPNQLGSILALAFTRTNKEIINEHSRKI